jgi:DNA-directed RNA polymerase specialized sigma24 family protein
VVQDGPSPEHACDFLDELEHDLQRLPERARQAVVMLLEGASHAAVAARLGITVRTVSTIIDRLRKEHAFAALEDT